MTTTASSVRSYFVDELRLPAPSLPADLAQRLVAASPTFWTTLPSLGGIDDPWLPLGIANRSADGLAALGLTGRSDLTPSVAVLIRWGPAIALVQRSFGGIVAPTASQRESLARAIEGANRLISAAAGFSSLPAFASAPVMAVDSHLAGQLWWPRPEADPQRVEDPWLPAITHLLESRE
jgi:hypothetical protein